MSEFKTQKEYLRYRGGIYKEKDDEVFKSKIRQLYKNKSIRTNWLKKELGILQKDNSNFITYIGLIVSSLVAAFATSIITKPEIFKQIKELGILAIIKTTGIILPFLIIFGIIILVCIIILLIPIIAVSITTKSVQRKNYEIDQIIGVLKKIEIKKIFDNETKCLLIKKLIKDLFIGVIAGIVATVIVWFSI